MIERAGLALWLKRFQSLRSARQAELENLFPSHVVIAWPGNSQSVAAKYHLPVIDDHFKAALPPALRHALNSEGIEGQTRPDPGVRMSHIPVSSQQFRLLVNCKVGDEGTELRHIMAGKMLIANHSGAHSGASVAENRLAIVNQRWKLLTPEVQRQIVELALG